MQPTLKDWLARTPRGPAPKKRLPKVTPKRAKQNREYSVRRKAFLLAHPFCQVWLKKEELYGEGALSEQYAIENNGHFRINSIPSTCPRSKDVHHRAGRIGEKLLDESDWIAASREGHLWLHAHPKEARTLGLLQ